MILALVLGLTDGSMRGGATVALECVGIRDGGGGGWCNWRRSRFPGVPLSSPARFPVAIPIQYSTVWHFENPHPQSTDRCHTDFKSPRKRGFANTLLHYITTLTIFKCGFMIVIYLKHKQIFILIWVDYIYMQLSRP